MSSIQALRTLDRGAIAGIVSPEALARGELYDHVVANGARPLDDDSVDEYKSRVQSRFWDMSAITSQLENAVDTVGGFIAMAVAGALIGAGIHASVGGFSVVIAGTAVFGAVLGLAAAVVTSLVIHSLWLRYTGAHWETVPLAQHLREGRKVPKRVLALAASLAKGRTDLEFAVERIKHDPFLTVSRKDMPEARFRVAVWGQIGYRIARA